MNKESLRIVILQDDFPPHSLGGAGMIAKMLAQGYQNSGHEVHVITTVKERELAGDERQDGIFLHRIFSSYSERWRSYRSLYNPSTVPYIRDLFKRIKPDIVHVHNIHYHLSYHTLLLAKKGGAKVFFTAHDALLFHYGKLDDFVSSEFSCANIPNYRVSALALMRKVGMYYNPFRNLVIRYYLRRVDGVVAVSSSLKNALEQNNIKVVSVIHNGIDNKIWPISGDRISEFKQKYNLSGKKIILFGGRLSDAKGGRQLLQALASVVSKIPTTLLLVGKVDEYAQNLKKSIKEMNMNQYVVFTGWLSGEELKAAYGASDVVCVLSQYLDPFPTINLEAMSAGKPVIGTCMGGTKEAVSDHENGLIINPLDKEALVQAIFELFEDDHKAMKYGESGRVRMEQFFGTEKMVNSYLALFREPPL